MRIISHNGFARETLVRHEVKNAQVCAWCGEKNAQGTLYSYAIVPDDTSKKHWLKGLFCSVGCMRAFHA